MLRVTTAPSSLMRKRMPRAVSSKSDLVYRKPHPVERESESRKLIG